MTAFPTDPTAARVELLRRLPTVGFVPPDDWVAAARGRAEPPPDATLRDAIETFASAFWSLAPAERRPRWQALLDRAAADRPLAARLRRLEAGVDLDAVAASAGPDQVWVLARHVQDLFARKPAERVARRAELTRRVFWPLANWEFAAQALRRTRPSLAVLDPLVQTLADGTERGRQAEWNRRYTPASSGAASAKQWPGVLILIGVVLALVRALSSTNTASPPPRYVPPPVVRPAPPMWPSDPTRQASEREAVQRILDQIKANAKQLPAPPAKGPP